MHTGKMRKLTILFIFLIFLISCKPQEAPKKGPFCGDNVCRLTRKKAAAKLIAAGLKALQRNNAQTQKETGMTAEARAQEPMQIIALKFAKRNASAAE